MHSTKAIEVEATFTARAGFDFARAFRITIDPVTGAVITQFPPGPHPVPRHERREHSPG